MKTDNTTPSYSEETETTAIDNKAIDKAIGIMSVQIQRNRENNFDDHYVDSRTAPMLTALEMESLINSYAILKAENERLLLMAEDLQNKYAESNGKAIRLQSDNEAKDKRIKELEGRIVAVMKFLSGNASPSAKVDIAYKELFIITNQNR